MIVAPSRRQALAWRQLTLGVPARESITHDSTIRKPTWNEAVALPAVTAWGAASMAANNSRIEILIIYHTFLARQGRERRAQGWNLLLSREL